MLKIFINPIVLKNKNNHPFIFPNPNNLIPMPASRKQFYEPFHLPQIRRHTRQVDKESSSSLYSGGKSILSRFQEQLKQKQRNYQSEMKVKRRVPRLKTIDVNDHETFDELRRELKSMKEQVSYKINEYNHRLASKIDEFVMLSSLKKDQQVLYQPFPVYLPPMYPPQMPPPPMMPPYIPEDEEDYDVPSPYQPYQNNMMYPNPRPVPKRSKKPFKIVHKNKLLKFRKAVFAVLFTIRLQKFAQKVINFRKAEFQKFLHETNEFRQEATLIKKILVEGLKPFLVTLLQKEDSQLKLNEGDSEKFKKQKIATTKKLFQILIEGLKKTVESESFNSVMKSIYYFCRHGSYACLEKLLTQEELENISVSEKHFYLQAQKNLEKSQIINFLFMKILIYNALGQSWKIDAKKFSKDKEVLQQNIIILCSILYELLMDIQDDFIVNSPAWYPLNNFQSIKGAKIYPSESLTVKPGQFRKNQVVSGLINENIIKATYKLEKLWVKQKNQLTQIVQKIHEKVVEYHRNLIKPFL